MKPEQPILESQLLAPLPPPWPQDPLDRIRSMVGRSGRKLIVLDDDPTGTQTVRQVPVFTGWSVDDLMSALAAPGPCAYVLTNSRSLGRNEAVALACEIGRKLKQASAATGRACVVASRSDSTLRGHYPAETDALIEAMNLPCDACILVPFFEAGGRLTVNNVHYLRDGEQMVPVAQSPFAKDPVFGYRHSDLRLWVEEKTCGRIPASEVRSVDLEVIRRQGPSGVAGLLADLENRCACVINAACQRDVEVVALALLEAESRGKSFLYRTAASLIPARCGMGIPPLLGRGEFGSLPSCGGLVICGSFVPRSTQQLEHLLRQEGLRSVELDVQCLLGSSRAAQIVRAAQVAQAAIQDGLDAVVYTSRKLIGGPDEKSNIAISRQVSEALVAVVESITAQPRYILAKGGITSSDIVTKACRTRSAQVIGQVAPGVPVWRLDALSRYPDMPVVIFPGNVGGTETLSRVVEMLRA